MKCRRRVWLPCCSWCGKEYAPKSKYNMFCSEECIEKAWDEVFEEPKFKEDQ